MITSNIQELFDGGLGDEQAAELFHTLSVSPERRADFHRHVSLHNAMQADRYDNRLTSDEDAAVWGAITGLGIAGSSAAAGSSSAWGTKIVFFLLSGIVGYILGTTSFGDIFGNGSSGGTTAANSAKPMAPFVVVPMPAAAPQAQAPADTRSSAPNISARSTASSRNTANAIALGDGDSRTAISAPTPRTATDNGLGLTTRSTEGGVIDGSTTSATQNTENGAASTSTTNANSERPTPRQDVRDTNSRRAPDATATQSIPHDPQQLLANSSHGITSPIADDDTPVAALTTNGFEVGYGHSVGMLRQTLSGESAETYSHPHLNVSYRFAGGSLGVGGRVGLGNFAMMAPATRSNNGGLGDGNALIRTDSVYALSSNGKQLALLELFANYRLLLGNKLALSLEGSFGGSIGNHLQAGGNASLIFFVSDRIGIQGGVGINRYWYNVTSTQPYLGTEGASIEYDSYVSRAGGTIFSANYGAFFHF